jgi:hypothetical protein
MRPLSDGYQLGLSIGTPKGEPSVRSVLCFVLVIHSDVGIRTGNGRSENEP